MTEYEIVVRGALPRYQMRQHLRLHSIHFQEEWQNDVIGATFTVLATPEQWHGIQQAKQEAER